MPPHAAPCGHTADLSCAGKHIPRHGWRQVAPLATSPPCGPEPVAALEQRGLPCGPVDLGGCAAALDEDVAPPEAPRQRRPPGRRAVARAAALLAEFQPEAPRTAPARPAPPPPPPPASQPGPGPRPGPGRGRRRHRRESHRAGPRAPARAAASPPRTPTPPPSPTPAPAPPAAAADSEPWRNQPARRAARRRNPIADRSVHWRCSRPSNLGCRSCRGIAAQAACDAVIRRHAIAALSHRSHGSLSSARQPPVSQLPTGRGPSRSVPSTSSLRGRRMLPLA